jgi:hypothetical protein
MNLRDIILRNARHYPGRDAVVFENRRVTHAQFAARWREGLGGRTASQSLRRIASNISRSSPPAKAPISSS